MPETNEIKTNNNNISAETTVLTPDSNEMEQKPHKVRRNAVTCQKSTFLLLLLFALAAMALAALITFLITKHFYHQSAYAYQSDDDQCRMENRSIAEPLLEQKSDGPTAEELRLPKDIVPIWYNITMKTYLPGYVELDANKNLTFDAALIIKFHVNEATDRIVLSALKLHLPDAPDKIKILQDKKQITTRSRRDNAIIENAVENTTLQSSTEATSWEVDQENEKNGDEETAISERPNTTKERTRPNDKTAADVQVKEILVNETLEKVTFVLNGDLNKGDDYYIQFTYTGSIDKKLAGLYLSRYLDLDGKERFLAITQMEPTDARRMVPCFDEPMFKAVWKVKVIHPVGTVAVSNGIELKSAEKTDKNDWVMTTFIESPPMSAYLLALAITDFDFNEGITKRGTRFRVWSRKEALNHTTYALNAGITALEFYEDYYNIPFPLKKQDMMAIPDFAAGAMENWGMVTYREKYLLYDKHLYTPDQKVGVALVVAHELAHQWFGNLVTMKWWNDLWLNEGFATFMEYLGADAISKGNFHMNDYFLNDAFDAALRRDGQATSHPLLFPIDKAEDVSEAFDDVTYSKGASVIYMIQQVMGPENFKKGLNIYLEQHKYHNADHDDLWSALNEAVPDDLLAWDGNRLDIRDFASKWTQQMGYPVIEVRRIEPHKIELHQRRFKWNEEALERAKFRNAKYWYKYDIPLWYQVNGEEKPMSWLHESHDLNLDVGDLLILNSDSHGFYRVNYNAELWNRITAQLMDDHTKISVRSRARLIDDAFSLAEANSLSYNVPLNLSQYLMRESEYLPWAMAISNFITILDNFDSEPETQYIRDYLLQLILPLYNRIDWYELDNGYFNDELFFENELQYAIIRLMCHIRNANCTSKLLELFHTKLITKCKGSSLMSSECSRVPIPIRGQVYCEGIKTGSEVVWDRLFGLYMRESVQVERDRLLHALTCSRDLFTLKKLLHMASNFNDTLIRLQDSPTTFSNVGADDVGHLIIFDYFQNHWSSLYKDLKDQQTLLRRIIQSSTRVDNQRQITELEDFVKEHRKETSKLDVFGQQLEKSKTRKLWKDRYFDQLAKWFRKQVAMQPSSNFSMIPVAAIAS